MLRAVHTAVLLSLFTLIGSAHAELRQPPDYTIAFPTLAALQNTPLPERDRLDLARRYDGVTSITLPPSEPPEHRIGDKQPFRVVNSSTDTISEVQATLRVISDHLLIWVESEAVEMVSLDTLMALADAFDERVYPNVRALWGEEANPGVDGDPRVYALFTRGVGSSAAAYFSSDNSYPPEATSAGNGHEMFVFNLDVIMQGVDDLTIESIVAHEFQHMIRHNLQPNEETWVNEGFSMLTELLLYNDPAFMLYLFMSMPDTQLNTWNEDSGLRVYDYGAAVAFLAYFYNNFGVDGLAALSADPSPRGLDAVDHVLRQIAGITADEFFADWVLANALVLPGDVRYGYGSLPIMVIPSFSIPVFGDSFIYEDTAFQYAADVYALQNAPSQPLAITLDAPRTVALIPDEDTADGRFWYSNRGDMMDSTLTRAFDLTGVDEAELNFRLWFDSEDGWDFGYVSISTDGGETWTPLEGTYTTVPTDPYSYAYGASYNGESGGWVEETVSLDAYAGQNILLRFEMITDDTVNLPGMAIDHVAIPQIGYAADFEEDDGGWEANGWLLTDNRLPQQAWVQVAQVSADGRLLGTERWLFAPPPDESEQYSQTWTFTPRDGAAQTIIIIAPFAPVTTEAMPYELTIVPA